MRRAHINLKNALDGQKPENHPVILESVDANVILTL